MFHPMDIGVDDLSPEWNTFFVVLKDMFIFCVYIFICNNLVGGFNPFEK